MNSKSLLLSVHCTSDFQELPGGILVEITDELLNAIERMHQCVKANELSEAGAYWPFATPKVVDDTVAEQLGDEECLVVDTQSYEDVEDIGGDRGHKLWVGDGYVWFEYYDKYSDAVIMSAQLSIEQFNDLTGPEITPAREAA